MPSNTFKTSAVILSVLTILPLRLNGYVIGTGSVIDDLQASGVINGSYFIANADSRTDAGERIPARNGDGKIDAGESLEFIVTESQNVSLLNRLSSILLENTGEIPSYLLGIREKYLPLIDKRRDEITFKTYRSEFENFLSLYPEFVRSRGSTDDTGVAGDYRTLAIKLAALGYQPEAADNVFILPDGSTVRAGSDSDFGLYANGCLCWIRLNEGIVIPVPEIGECRAPADSVISFYENGVVNELELEDSVRITVPRAGIVDIRPGSSLSFTRTERKRDRTVKEHKIDIPGIGRITAKAGSRLSFYPNGSIRVLILARRQAIFIPAIGRVVLEKNTTMSFREDGSLSEFTPATRNRATTPASARSFAKRVIPFFYPNREISVCRLSRPLKR